MKRKQWQTLVNEFHKSGLSKRAFTKKHDLVYSQLLYYIRQLSPKSTETTPNDLVPVKIRSPVIAKGCSVLGIIEFPNGTRLLIHSPELLNHISSLLQS